MRVAHLSNKAYLLSGSNIGNKAKHLGRAMEEIQLHCGKIIRKSSIYETAAWGKPDQANFLNQAFELRTDHSPEELMSRLLDIEHTLGRSRDEKYGPRIIDLDILFFNHLVIDSSSLTIPHPEIQHRRFALVPLEEIAPFAIHPVFCTTVRQLLKECRDGLDVKKI